MTSTRPRPFHQYVATFFLSRLPWRRQLLILGKRVCHAPRAVAAARNAYVCAAAIGRARPELVPKLVESCCQPGSWQAVFEEAAAQARGRIGAAGASPDHFDQLFPEDFDPGLMESSAPFDSVYALAQVRVVEGLTLGKEHPELAGRLLLGEFRSVVESLKWRGASLPVEMTAFQDFEQQLLSVAEAWEASEA